ncbi:hypothetical protein H4R21_002638 [Coemansia helicoidea]|uniref:Uncharacterized protein n=1 Tax=Coemansia helicoidea TaxID=1286919 RepID=A0ACC1L609_9FUNG|nr:hypothetical protein H4R21_002638 [Coemansia helicoidea]
MSLPPACTAAPRFQPAPALLPVVPAAHKGQQAIFYHTSVPELGGTVVTTAAAVAATTLAEPPPPLTAVPYAAMLADSRAELPYRGHTPFTAPPAADDGRFGSVKGGGVHKPKRSTSSSSPMSSASNHGPRRSAPTAGGGDSRAMRAGSPPIRATGSDCDDDGDDDDDGNGASASGNKTTASQRRQRFLERNRIAASKCRQKKKMWVLELERRAEDMTMQNRSLHITIAQLKDEIMALKNQLLAHHNCGCSAIHQYFQAERVVSDILPAAVPLAAPPLMPPVHRHHPVGPTTAVAAAPAAVAVGGAMGTVGPPLLLPPQAQAQAALIVQQQQQQRITSTRAYPPHAPAHAPPGALMGVAQSPTLAVAPGTFGWTPTHPP